jgi:hypothetical protein
MARRRHHHLERTLRSDYSKGTKSLEGVVLPCRRPLIYSTSVSLVSSIFLTYSFPFLLPFFLNASIGVVEDICRIDWNPGSIFSQKAISNKGM